MALFSVVLLCGAGCGYLPRKSTVPMPVSIWKSPGPVAARTLVVFLPGRRDGLNVFEQRGFISAMHNAGINADALVADAHIGYYFDRTVIERLRKDVLTPARSRGYRRIVVVGVSLGGLGALLCERDAPGSIDEIVLVAPYLGERTKFFDEIGIAGGPAAWAENRVQTGKDIAPDLWTFLGQRSAHLPSTWLLYGTSDSFAPGQRMLSGLLPAAQVMAIPGGHDWATWSKLWHAVCESSDVFIGEKAPRRVVER